jgi:hypothetical protein
MEPSESYFPTQNPSAGPTQSVEPSIMPSSIPSVSVDPTSTPSMIWCLTNTYKNFESHEATANSLQGHLVSIHSEEDNYLAHDIVSNVYAWIGFNDLATEANYVWSDGSEPNFLSWGQGEPNYGYEDCTLINTGLYKWINWPCDKNYLAVYKLPISSLCGALSAGYKCYEEDSTGCSSSLNCKKALTTCPTS